MNERISAYALTGVTRAWNGKRFEDNHQETFRPQIRAPLTVRLQKLRCVRLWNEAVHLLYVRIRMFHRVHLISENYSQIDKIIQYFFQF